MAKNEKSTSAMSKPTIAPAAMGKARTSRRDAAAELQIKLRLAAALRKIVEQKGLTQVRTAEILRITQPNIWEVLHDRLRGYSVARLMRFLVALDHDVEIHIRPKAGSRSARITVHAE